jgi:hypothetical protein
MTDDPRTCTSVTVAERTVRGLFVAAYRIHNTCEHGMVQIVRSEGTIRTHVGCIVLVFQLMSERRFPSHGRHCLSGWSIIADSASLSLSYMHGVVCHLPYLLH